ncbi:RNase adapter RapZ [Oceanicoccus sagamiensis]|uniref:RNase adaptor protein RapZ n=1 Tax=Oceanicoccus sagamiensis TaxID=716816 RepID=A0A1X9NB68_9GAMM|nr:RNase adapter RapZ [Oceanicoccus sagamiensis]ARN74856.1 RNase adaptor protein RapZ [Oceanicoccus sagamiensis]
MKLVIISGRSGSGKSTALNLLEDEGYYCIDNLPVALIPQTVGHLQSSSAQEHNKVAICVDARNASQDLSNLVDLVYNKPDDLDIDILFLDADSEKLIVRFSETRRRHPLSNKHTALTEAIINERKLLEPIADIATLTIDTSSMSLHELRTLIKSRLVEKDSDGISILFQSFGFKQGVPVDADIVYDIRILPNPHWDPSLRALTGQNQPVIDFLNKEDDVNEMYSDIKDYLIKWLPLFEHNNRSYITVGIGCTGGQHRSVYMAERLGRHFEQHYNNVQIRHRELDRLTAK